MQGVEIAHLNAAIVAVLKAFYDFMHSTVEEALRPISAYGKSDTLGMDAGPEITIVSELSGYDNGAVVITEEVGAKGIIYGDAFRPNEPQTFRTVFICDPTDRSNQLKQFLKAFPPESKILDIFLDPETIQKWESSFGAPASITSATSAISCVRHGVPIFAVVVNYVTREMFVSCAAGNRVVQLPSERGKLIDFDYVREKGERIIFPGISRDAKSMRRFVTFLGDVGKVGYSENFRDSGLMTETEKGAHLHYGMPGGPSRVLYLSSMQSRTEQVGFVLANGEKIGEWIHWMSFAQYARDEHDSSKPALAVFEVFQQRPWTKEGVLMSTHPDYSIFREYGGKLFVDTSWLLRMSNPSKYRATLIVAPHDNRWAARYSGQSGFRQIRF